jgi:PTS system fructose-specific IIC component
MVLMNLLSEACICLHLRSTSKESVLAELVDLLDRAGKLQSRESFLQALLTREATGSTGLQHGVAVPHARGDSVREAAIAFGISREGIDFGSLDGEPSQFFLLIAEPDQVDSRHLEILADASRHLVDPDFRQRLLAARSGAEVLRLFATAEAQEPIAQIARQPAALVAAVTSCPAGISHTYMAADRLRQCAQRMGVAIKVETHGSVGVKDELSAHDIEQARAVILAVDRKINKDRFAGKRLIEVWVAEAIRDPEKLLARALEPEGGGAATAGEPAPPPGAAFKISDIYRHLMNGVSNVLPFVVAGGALISLSLLLGGDGTDSAPAASRPLAALLMTLGGVQGAFGLLVPVLAGFIGRSIADRPGLMPAMVGGLIMAQAGAGFIGGMIAGLLGGYGILAVKRLCRPLPQQLEAIRDVLILPLLGLLLSGGLVLLLSAPVAALNQVVVDWLAGLELGHRLLLGILLGGLMAVDMGGPINKGAYTFGLVAIEMGNFLPQAAVMAGGMVPPLALGIAILLFPSRFTETEQKAGRSCLVMGASFITEAAIPFAATDPMRVIPACFLGAALAGGLSMAFGCQLMAPHGGVFVLPLVGQWPLYALAIASGALLAACLLGLLKRRLPSTSSG